MYSASNISKFEFIPLIIFLIIKFSSPSSFKKIASYFFKLDKFSLRGPEGMMSPFPIHF